MPAKKAAKKNPRRGTRRAQQKKPRTGARRRARAGTSTLGNVRVVNMIPRSLSGETEQDSEPFLAVNPANPLQMVGSAFTPDPFGGPQAPVYVTSDGGKSRDLRATVPSNVQTGDITVAYSGGSNNLYSGILRRPGNLLLNILRTPDAFGTAAMNVLSSRTQVDQPFVQATVVSGKEHVFVGSNDFAAPNGRSATIDFCRDASAISPAFSKARIETRSTVSQDGPQIRPTSHPDGTVYAIFYRWRAFTDTDEVTADVVVVRDDHGGAGAQPFRALVDPGDGRPGRLVAQGVKFVWDDLLGQQRLGGNLSIAIDPRNSSTLYAAWCDVRAASYTIHVTRSLDRGVTWSADIRTISRGTNAALAVNSDGVVGFLCQRVRGSGAAARWVTEFQHSTNGSNWTSVVLANVPATTPPPQFQPYIGDYNHLVAVGRAFYGIFSANNRPNRANFPNGVAYQRNHDFATRRLLDLNGNLVSVSIDPFFFKVS
jgi:hypothetical protein